MKNNFRNIIPINGFGFKKEYKNNNLMSVRLIKLLSYDEELDEYRFQYDSHDSKEFLTVNGDGYPNHTWVIDEFGTEMKSEIIFSFR